MSIAHFYLFRCDLAEKFVDNFLAMGGNLSENFVFRFLFGYVPRTHVIRNWVCLCFHFDQLVPSHRKDEIFIRMK